MHNKIRFVGKMLSISVVCSLSLLVLVSAHEEHDSDYWNHQAHDLLFEKKDYTMQKINVAKNIVVFVGAGMSQATVTAARTVNGGENATFAFEKLKWSGNARTYCVDSRVPDSACASTAFLTGVKSNFGTVAVQPSVKRGNCLATGDKVKQLESIAKWALDSGKVVGFATTSRVTAGSNAALYANSADKDWENDASVSAAGCNPREVNDIAYQLVHGDIGKHFKVIFGGGRKNFIPANETDKSGARGERADGRNLIGEWQASKSGNAVYISTAAELGALNTSNIDYLLGLFDYDRLPYAVDIGEGQNVDAPPLVRMVHYSLEMLQKKEHSAGFLLFVEDGNIQEAHRENKPYKALQQVKHYAMAFNMGHMMVSETNTLVISMNDVGSTLSIPGYPQRNTEALTSAGVSDKDSKPYLSLAYATGPAYDSFYNQNEGRLNPLTVLQGMASQKESTCSAAVPMIEGVNGGEDASVYASGPWAFMLSGGFEQNFIAHTITFASCITDICGGASSIVVSTVALALAIVVKFFV
ncbi:membrane-bound alkaline phosphatase-like [Toxorhynchites rutilus septentrionalis]|uniref:membrane-bound alkaline phosphatase-like n=1 Tax=Toxorhynchites rutilus septentrionalis TaxID=329112 RepID=UPI002478920A|nr:membrane-bound alkaline phosphatase-like [Toxorhynchites rutilus septentrionalis]